jgi:peptide/nickel transport system substrate-binding protein
MARITSIIAALLVLMGAAAAAKTPSDQLVVAWNLDAVITLDPAQIGEVNGDEIMRNVCDSLVVQDIDDAAKIVPALAESWSASEDGVTLTFTLRPGLKFPSGKPATAQDLAWSMQRVLHLNFGNSSTLKEWGFTTENAEHAFRAADDRTLVVTMDRPYPPNLILAAVFANRVTYLLEREELLKHVKDNDYGNAWLKTTSACVGPYKVRSFNANDVLMLERNDEYYGAKPKLRRVVIRHVPESGAERLQLETGDIDVAHLLSADDLQGVAPSKEIRVEHTTMHGFTYLALNTADPILANPKVRLAFRYLVDYQGLAKTVMKDLGVPRASLVPAGAFGALSKEEGQPFKLDIERAKQLLAEAGYPNGFTKKFIVSSNAFNPALAQNIQSTAAKVGITLEIEQMTDGTLFNRNRARDFEICQIGWQTNYADAHAMISRHAINPDNRAEAKLAMLPVWRAAFQDQAINEMAETAMMERNEGKRVALYHEIQKKLMAEGPFVYMFQQVRSIAVRNEVKDFKLSPFRIGYALASK